MNLRKHIVKIKKAINIRKVLSCKILINKFGKPNIYSTIIFKEAFRFNSNSEECN